MPELLPYQEYGARWLAVRRAAYLGDEMRLGKTVQTIRALDLLDAKRALIVCPAIAKINWAREFERWGTIPRKTQVVNGSKALIDPSADVIIANYDICIRATVARQLAARRYDAVVADEAHRLQSRNSLRTSVMLRPGGLMSRGAHAWFLSGTFLGSRPAELYPILRAAAPHLIEPMSTWPKFNAYFCGGDGKGAMRLDELGQRIKPFYLRREQKDVWTQLPKVREQMLALSPDESTRQLLMREIEIHEIGYGDSGEDHIGVVRRELGLAKVRAAIDHVHDVMKSVHKLVVFGHHRDVISKLFDGLKRYNCVRVWGGDPMASRQKAMDSFKSDHSVRVFVAQMQSAGEAIDLSASSMVLFVEQGWVPREMSQAMARVQGLGQKADSILVQHLVYEKSLDEHMIQTRWDKERIISTVERNAALTLDELIA